MLKNKTPFLQEALLFFQVLLTVMLMWGLCGLLTVSGHLPEEHPARTDYKIKIIEDAPWFRIPYPGR
jgi:nucleobase transporter 1/2